MNAVSTLPTLRSLPAGSALDVLDLERPDLAAVRQEAARGNRDAALTALLHHFRRRFPRGPVEPSEFANLTGTADQIVRHVFQWGPCPEVAYGPDVRWAADPVNDIEWIAAINRFYWAIALAEAYAATGDELYAATFVELASDWIRKHPLEDALGRPLGRYGRPGFMWLDIQTGERAKSICRALPALIHAKAFTPGFLAIILASLHDHQIKTLTRPKAYIHNKSFIELAGLTIVPAMFPEFAEGRSWMQEVARRATIHLLGQTTASGAHTEWCGSYHKHILQDAQTVADRVSSFGLAMPAEYLDRLDRMYDFLLGISTPDLGVPMFGDTARPDDAPEDDARYRVTKLFRARTERTGDPAFAGVANRQSGQCPAQASFAFADAGHYVFRSSWGLDDIYLALHCTPPALMQKGPAAWGHDEPDNGTFELWAYGRWLMTDTGFYVYGNCAEAALREWHRRTCNHQTMTLDQRDTAVLGSCVKWNGTSGVEKLVVENQSYAELRHRRTIWFVDRAFFAVRDEAIGEAPGELNLHFQLAPGPAQIDPNTRSAHTLFPDANVLVWQPPWQRTVMHEVEGWSADTYGRRRARTAFRYRHLDAAPASFVTLLVPYRGTSVPSVQAEINAAGKLSVCVNEKQWRE